MPIAGGPVTPRLFACQFKCHTSGYVVDNASLSNNGAPAGSDAAVTDAFALAARGELDIVELMNAAELLKGRGQRDGAIALYRSWLEHTSSPVAYAASFNLGVELAAQQQYPQAEAMYRQALEQHPELFQARLNLGNCLEQQKREDEALEQWRLVCAATSIGLPENRSFQLLALNNLGRLLETTKQYQASLDMLEKSFAIDPSQKDVLIHLVHLIQKICRWPIYLPPKGITLQEMVAGTSPLAMLAASDDPALQLAAARSFVEYKYPVADLPPLAPEEGYRHKKVRIGYLSSDFCMHAVSLLTIELLELHDHERFEIYGFCWSREDGSVLRNRMIGAMDHHVRIEGMSDKQAAECIRSHEIDIIVDLQGLTSGARPLILSYRPATVQMTYLGFPGATGLPWIDYVIADKYLIPEELVPFHTEKPLYLPNCFQASDSHREVGPMPTRAANGLPEDALVFCSFNNNYKFTPELFAVWMRILKRVPDSVLWLLADNEWAQENLVRAAKKQGIKKERLIFAPRVAPADYLARYQLADLFLDTFPFNGGTTANDALFMGLPLLTLSGRTFASRMAGSLLTHLGVPELIATDLKQYEEKAVGFAKNREQLTAIRKHLLDGRSSSTVFDMPQFVRNYENKLCETLVESVPQGVGTVHFAYAGPPDNTALHAPFSITRNIYRALSAKYQVAYYDYSSKVEIPYGPDDIVIGHPHYDHDTVMQKALRNPAPCRAKILMFPLHTKRTEDNWPFNDLVEYATSIISICGPYWYDSIDTTIFKHWQPKIVRLDMAVDSAAFPFMKQQVNPVGQRKLLYLGSAIPNKNLGFMAKIMETLSHAQLTWLGADLNHPICKLPNVNAIGWQQLTAETMKPYVDGHDFFISTSDSDANPTTILESMAWGIVPICTKESGYWPDGEYMGEIVLADFHKTVHNIISFLNMPEERYRQISLRNRKLIEADYNWENLTGKVLQEIGRHHGSPAAPKKGRSRVCPPAALKLFCVGHVPPLFEPGIEYTMLCPAPLGMPNELVIEDNRFGLSVDGTSLAEYSQLFGLYELISAGDVVADQLFLFQYRKYLSPINGGLESASPWVRVVRTKDADQLFPSLGMIEEIAATVVIGSLFNLSESTAGNYAMVHVIDDFVMFMAACATSPYLTPEDIREFATFRGLIPSPAVCYVETAVFLKIMKILKQVCEEYLRNYHIKREGYQRRVAGYLLERLHSYLLVKWLTDGSEPKIHIWNRYVVTND